MNLSLTIIGILTAIPAVIQEYLYKTRGGNWYGDLWLYLPIQLCISYGVWRLVTTPGTTLLDAFVVWAFSTVAMRCMVSQFFLHETIAPGTWAALVILMVARYVQYTWR